MEDLYQLVKDELLKLPVKIKKAGKSWMIPCPFHPDTDPSLSVNVNSLDVPPGVFMCFGCGAHGSWNKLATALGLRLFTSQQVKEARRAFIGKTNDNWVRYKPPRLLEDLPPKFKFRLYSSKLLKHFDCKLWVDPVLNEKRLWVPVKVLGELLGHVTLSLNKYSPKTRNSPGTWATRAFWPYDYVPDNSVIFLVEGVTDALRLLSHGLYALANLGGPTVWSNYKKELILLKNPKKVFLVPDGDETGYRLAKIWKKQLKPLVPTSWVKLPIRKPKLDPDNMPDKYVRYLIKLSEEVNGGISNENGTFSG